MSANNRELTKKKGAAFSTVSLTTATTNVAYTAKVGSSSDGFHFDTFIRVDTTSESVMTITVPDGVYYGQQLHVLMEVLGGSATVDVTTDSGDDATQISAAGGYWIGEWHGTTIGWSTLAGSAT